MEITHDFFTFSNCVTFSIKFEIGEKSPVRKAIVIKYLENLNQDKKWILKNFAVLQIAVSAHNSKYAKRNYTFKYITKGYMIELRHIGICLNFLSNFEQLHKDLSKFFKGKGKIEFNLGMI